MSLPARVDLDAYHGDTYVQTFLLPVDLTGATIAAEARNRAGDVTELSVEVTDAPTGRIDLGLPADFPYGPYVYDIEVIAGGEVRTWVRGNLRVERDVTNE